MPGSTHQSYTTPGGGTIQEQHPRARAPGPGGAIHTSATIPTGMNRNNPSTRGPETHRHSVARAIDTAPSHAWSQHFSDRPIQPEITASAPAREPTPGDSQTPTPRTCRNG